MADLDRTGDLEVRIVGTDGATEASVTSSNRLQVTAQLESGGDNPIFTLQPFVPYLICNASGTTIDSATYTSLLSVSNTGGKLDFIAVGAGSSTYRVKLTIDSATVYDLSMLELNSIGLANAINVEIWAETANKNFRHRPNIPLDFTDNMKVEIKATGATMTVYYLITHREGEF